MSKSNISTQKTCDSCTILLKFILLLVISLFLLSCQKKSSSKVELIDLVKNFSQADQVSEEVYYDFTNESSLENLILGWQILSNSQNQADHPHRIEVWASDYESVLRIFINSKYPRELQFQLKPVLAPGVKYCPVSVTCNSYFLDYIWPEVNSKIFTLNIPADIIRLGFNTIGFEFQQLYRVDDPLFLANYGLANSKPQLSTVLPHFLAAKLDWLRAKPILNSTNSLKKISYQNQKGILDTYIPSCFRYRFSELPENPHLQFSNAVISSVKEKNLPLVDVNFGDKKNKPLKINFEILIYSESSHPKTIYTQECLIENSDYYLPQKEIDLSKYIKEFEISKEKPLYILFSTGFGNNPELNSQDLFHQKYSALWVEPKIISKVVAKKVVFESDLSPNKVPDQLKNKPNVVLITLDTLRADRLSCYGCPLPISPVLDKIAKSGVIFTQTVAAAPCTLPSHASIMTSRYPTEHGAYGSKYARMSDNCITLAEILNQAGYLTAAWVNLLTVHSRFGFNRGFDYFDDFLPRGGRNAIDTLDLTKEWIIDNNRGVPFFLWLHYNEPHFSYNPHLPYIKIFKPVANNEFSTVDRRVLYQYKPTQSKIDPDLLFYIKALYDNEICYLDEFLYKILKIFESYVDRETVFIFVSDHGEEFKEHGSMEHDHTLYEELIQVPLIISYPKELPQGLIIKDPVHHIDLAPTILDLLDLPIPEDFRGVSLLKYIKDKETFSKPQRILISEKHNPPKFLYKNYIFSARLADWKLILDGSGKQEFYNLGEDPQEKNNLIGKYPEIEEKLTTVLNPLILLKEQKGEEKLEISEDVKEALQALGYLGD